MRSVYHRVEFAAGDERFVAVERVEDPSAAWSLRVDATDGRATLVGRGYLVDLGDDLLVLVTEGEHRRTGAPYNHKIHRILPDGRIAWSLRARPVGDPLRLGDYLLLPTAPVPPRHAFADHEPPAVQLQVRDPETGMLLATFPVHAPPVLRAAYRHSARNLGARLVATEHGVRVVVSGWFTGEHAPPRGAGEFDALILVD